MLVGFPADGLEGGLVGLDYGPGSVLGRADVVAVEAASGLTGIGGEDVLLGK